MYHVTAVVMMATLSLPTVKLNRAWCDAETDPEREREGLLIQDFETGVYFGGEYGECRCL